MRGGRSIRKVLKKVNPYRKMKLSRIKELRKIRKNLGGSPKFADRYMGSFMSGKNISKSAGRTAKKRIAGLSALGVGTASLFAMGSKKRRKKKMK